MQGHNGIRRPSCLDQDEQTPRASAGDEQAPYDRMGPGHLLGRLQAEPEKKAANSADERERPEEVDTLEPFEYRLIFDFGGQSDVHFDCDQDEGEDQDGCLGGSDQAKAPTFKR